MAGYTLPRSASLSLCMFRLTSVVGQVFIRRCSSSTRIRWRRSRFFSKDLNTPLNSHITSQRHLLFSLDSKTQSGKLLFQVTCLQFITIAEGQIRPHRPTAELDSKNMWRAKFGRLVSRHFYSYMALQFVPDQKCLKYLAYMVSFSLHTSFHR